MILTLLTWLYHLIAGLLALYTAGQSLLLLHYLRRRMHPVQDSALSEYPSVTVQLPIYNEKHVVERLLHAVAALDYPREKLHIQVLDDSDDETCFLLTSQIAAMQTAGLSIAHVRRPLREGYKAGALAYGLRHTDSDFIAIFDADFVPQPDFLRRVLPVLLADERCGVVQTRWGHLNDRQNWLTRAQALSVDTHFWIEQSGRDRAGYFLPFNGTGGIWRRACIDDAGGWSWDTLTEDLDLSYRAQLGGWHSAYLPDVVVPGELPAHLSAYRQQQTRWAMGSTQCLIKLSPILSQTRLPLMVRLMAWHHLAQYLPQPLILLLLLLSPLLLLTQSSVNLMLPGLMAFVPPLMYIITRVQLYAHPWRGLLAFPGLVLLATGMIWHNTRAIAGIFQGAGNVFRRTPKFADVTDDSDYAPMTGAFYGEWALMLYALFGAGLALYKQSGMLIYLLLYALSFLTLILQHRREQSQQKQIARQAQSPEKQPSHLQKRPF